MKELKLGLNFDRQTTLCLQYSSVCVSWVIQVQVSSKSQVIFFPLPSQFSTFSEINAIIYKNNLFIS